MSDSIGQIKVKARDRKGKGAARKLRAAGHIPGVMYGRGKDAVMLEVDPKQLRRAMDPERKLNTFFQVEVEGSGTEPCILADVQLDPIKDTFQHVDFLRVDPEEEVTTKIPVEYTGRAVGVVAGGKLKTHRRFVRVAAKPAEIPVKLLVDIGPLEGGQSIRLSDMDISPARLMDRADTVVAHVEMPKAKADEDDKAKKP